MAHANSVTTVAVKELEEYFEGRRKQFTVKLDVQSGTEFQHKAWNVLRGIPYGETISYKKEAELMEMPEAVRAVGLANGKNPVAIIVPCHRVIASDGKLAGYAYGIERKQFMLDLEAKHK